jgi:hypothetical protein
MAGELDEPMIRVRNKTASSKFEFFEFFDVEKTSM